MVLLQKLTTIGHVKSWPKPFLRWFFLSSESGWGVEMHISRREIEKREIGDREISREKWGIEKSGKN